MVLQTQWAESGQRMYPTVCVCVNVRASMGEDGGRGEEGRSVHVCDISTGIGSGFFLEM